MKIENDVVRHVIDKKRSTNNASKIDMIMYETFGGIEMKCIRHM